VTLRNKLNSEIVQVGRKDTITFMSSLIFVCNSMIVRSLVSSVSRNSLFFFRSSANS